MRSSWRLVAGSVFAAGLLVAVACGHSGSTGSGSGSGGGCGSGCGGSGGGGGAGGGSGGGGGPGGRDGGSSAPDAGGGANPGGGGQDGGSGGSGSGGGGSGGGGSDAGCTSGCSDGGNAGGGQDAGTDGGVTIVPPSLGANWQFASTTDGLPSGNVMAVSADEGGNLWVAGGTQGLFLRKPGSTSFQKFTLADGLHPYGYLAGQVATDLGVPQGSPADPNPSLDATPVRSIAGGVAGTVFVGYQGRGYQTTRDCEDEWDRNGATTLAEHEQNDPAIYKSGDADRVTLNGTGISVVHYDIFSGPNVVKNEPPGREKLCTILRIVYEHGTNRVWFGANHGYAEGYADFAGNPTCDGQLSCTGALEHSHPGFNDDQGDYVTGDYWGIAIDPLAQNGFHDIWFGGMARTTRFRFRTADYDASPLRPNIRPLNHHCRKASLVGRWPELEMHAEKSWQG